MKEHVKKNLRRGPKRGANDIMRFKMISNVLQTRNKLQIN